MMFFCPSEERFGIARRSQLGAGAISRAVGLITQRCHYLRLCFIDGVGVHSPASHWPYFDIKTRYSHNDPSVFDHTHMKIYAPPA
jgi:hypothetical protein